jgi:hypothetical protein
MIAQATQSKEVKISSDFGTAVNKALSPVFVAAFGFAALYTASTVRAFSDLVSVGVPVALTAMAFYWCRLSWRLADDVFDCGSFLLFRRGKLEERISFSNIQFVEVRPMQRQQRIVLSLVFPGAFGQQVSFIPAGMYTPMFVGQTELARQIEARAAAARGAAASE